jgi:Notch-like protein
MQRPLSLLSFLIMGLAFVGCDDTGATGTEADRGIDAAVGRNDRGVDQGPRPDRPIEPPVDAAQPDAADPDAAVDATPPPVDMAPADMARPDAAVDQGGCAPQETCGNGLDDDCNGTIDDPLVCTPDPTDCVPDAPCETGRLGICAAGRSRCPNGPDGEAECDALEAPAAERCDGALDEDCDGSVDEGFDLGAECVGGQGACRTPGEVVCGADGAAACSAVPPNPRAERCDGFIDEDCDGTVDEGFANLGEVCTVGDGVCQAEGRVACNVNGNGTRCNARPGGPSSELCNGADDDCDLRADENFADLGQPCVLGQGACRAEGTRVCFSGDRTYCNAEPIAPTLEVCNTIDDDCDGRADEAAANQPLTEACYVGPAGTLGVGLCRAGRRTCAAGAFGACAGEVRPTEEVCDGLDQDCDGRVDEAEGGGPLRISCYAGAEGTANIGSCRSGNRTCRNGALSACEGQVLPRAEFCDGADNNCNGRVDDLAGGGGCNCAPGVSRDCYSGPANTDGVGACTAGRQSCRADGNGFEACFGEIVPDVEACDGQDDDCDGRTDENIDGVGQACTEGVGVCARAGRLICDPNRGTRCNVVVGEPDNEMCNGSDDDCDGRTDELYRLGQPCRLGIGACVRDGEVVCTADGRGSECSVQAAQPQAERCDTVDNDCDGRTDEGLGLGQACEVGVGACLAGGILRCSGDGRVVCSAQPNPPQAERCDTRDNDCDGRTDEAFALGQACTSGEGNCEAQGVTRCGIDGGVECSANVGQGVLERCDAFDNDCDGTTDEGFVVGEPCQEGVGACRIAGVTECGPDGRVTCDAEPQVPVNETCDAGDNDCDGRIDEGFNVGAACTSGLGECSRAGVNECFAGAVRCSAVQGPPGIESCQGTDQDCDGRIDEGFGVGQACNAGIGACGRAGVTRCTADGVFGCSAVPADPVAERCDSQDNDCDARTDEGFNLGQFCQSGLGVCRRDGQTRCGPNGQLGCSAVPAAPGVETCDGRDEDCDGRTDEGFNLGQVCQVGVGECVSQGTLRCAAGGGTECGVPAGQARVEVCDNRDNDCDNRVDEGFSLGQPCMGGEAECAYNGVFVCGPDLRSACNGQRPAGRAEICDDLDNDCDDRADEGGVCPDLEDPEITLVLEPVFVLFNGNARVNVTVTDDRDPDPSVVVTVDGEVVQLDQNGQYLYLADTPGAIEVRVVATDAAGHRSEAVDYFRVQNLDDNTAPTVRILSPADTAELTTRTPIRGRLEDPNFFEYVLEFSLDRQNWVLLNRAQHPGGADVLVGELDPTVLPPGYVYVKLTGYDENSLNQFQIVTYRIPEGASIGETKMTLRDFHMPLKGLPITFDRGYDSRRKFQSGDFGFGWRLTSADAAVAEDLQSNVGVGLPNGKRDFFAIRYNFPGFFPFGTMDYVAAQGTFSTLTSPDACAVVNTQTGVVCFDTGRPPSFSVNDYVLTTPDGTRYFIHDVDGLQRIVDREGNEVVFEDDAIRSNLGVELTWTRDAAGRITTLTDPRGGVIEYRYDLQGNLSEVEDQAGGIQRFTYNNEHSLLGITGPDGNPVLRTEYDADGRKVRDIDPIGGETTYVNDLDGRRQTVTNRIGEVIVYEYNDKGQVTRRVDERGNAATFEFNALGQLTREGMPDGTFLTYTYDARGNQSRIVQPSGRAATYTYDATGQPTTLTNALNHRLTLGYDAQNRLTTVTNGAGHVRTIEYDAAGNRAAIIDADGSRVDYSYDALGNISDIDSEDGFARRYTYNEANLMSAFEDSDGARVQLAYDGVGRLTTLTDALGGRITMQRDGLGRMTRVTDVDGSVRSFTYDPRGLFATVTDPLNQTTRYAYDGEGRLTRITLPLGGQISYERDAGGNVTRRTDPLGNASTFGFDAMGRVIQRTPRGMEPIVFEYSPNGNLTRKSHPIDGIIVFEYDDVDRMTATQDPTGRTTFAFDAVDRLIAETLPDGTRIDHAWDEAGRRLSTNGPGGEVMFGYTDRNRMAEIVDPDLDRIVLERTAEGYLGRILFPNGITVAYTYDANKRPTRWEARNAQGIVAFEAATFDPAGRPTRIERDGNQRVELTYDAAGQVTRSRVFNNGVAGRDVAYVYDAHGNRTRRTINGVVENYTYDADNRLTRDGTFTYRHDPEGNVVERTRLDGAGRETFAYNTERHMTAWRRFNAQGVQTGAVDYRYDARGQLVARIEGAQRQNYAHSFGEKTWVRDAQGNLLERYLHGDQIDQVLAMHRPDGGYFFVLDGRGDVAAVFDEAGQRVGRYLYDDFGDLLEQVGDFVSPLGFGGRPRDAATGLYDFRSRVLDPSAGRFLQQDPEVGRLTEPITMHPYMYGFNSPHQFRDPSGRAAAISYAFLTSRFVKGSVSVNSPNVYEMGGSLIGFMHGFSAGALFFLGNILEMANNGQDIIAGWGAAVSKTEQQLDALAAVLSRMGAVDPGGNNGGSGFPGAFVNGAGINVGFSIKLNVPGPVDKGIKLAGGKNGVNEKFEIVKAQGGFKNGGKEFLNYVRQLAP